MYSHEIHTMERSRGEAVLMASPDDVGARVRAMEMLTRQMDREAEKYLRKMRDAETMVEDTKLRQRSGWLRSRRLR